MRRRDQDSVQPEANQSQASNAISPVCVAADDVPVTSLQRSPSSTSSKLPHKLFFLFFGGIDNKISTKFFVFDVVIRQLSLLNYSEQLVSLSYACKRDNSD